jgi:hypothetical protein
MPVVLVMSAFSAIIIIKRNRSIRLGSCGLSKNRFDYLHLRHEVPMRIKKLHHVLGRFVMKRPISK